MVILLLIVILTAFALLGNLFGVRRNTSTKARSAAPDGDKPNIILFVVDDLDVRTMQIMLANDLLPHIKSKIVNQAVEFRNAIVPTSICSP